MAGEGSPERLPVGWTEQISEKDGLQLTFYYNVITGQKFYSKADLLRYIELGCPSRGTRQQTRARNEGNPETRPMLMPAETINTPDWLPQGWIMELNATSDGRKYKVYIDPSTGRKFYSKPEIFRYLNPDKDNELIPKQISRIIGSDGNLPTETVDTPDWLPQGWIMELNTKGDGKKKKVYIDPSTGRKCYSKPEVFRYVNSDKDKNPVPKQTSTNIVSHGNSDFSGSAGAETPQKPEGAETVKSMRSISSQMARNSSSSYPRKVEIERYSAEGLPPGWIKEIKIEIMGSKIRKDPYFTDPVSNYVFRSRPDALRYLKTNDITACAIKPKKRTELEFLSDDVNISEEKQTLDNPIPSYDVQISEEMQSLENTANDVTEKIENCAPTRDQPPGSPVLKRKRGRPVAAAPSTAALIQQIFNFNASIDPTKPEGEKVQKLSCRRSPRIAESKPESVHIILDEVEETYNGVRTDEKSEESLKPPTLQGLRDGSFFDPCFEFAYKTLRGDIPVEANNLAAQGYNHHLSTSINVGMPSFSDYARRR